MMMPPSLGLLLFFMGWGLLAPSLLLPAQAQDPTPTATPSGPPPTASLFAQAQWKLDNQDWRGAVADLSQLIEPDEVAPMDAAIGDLIQARLHRGMAYSGLGDSTKAMADWTWVIEISSPPSESDETASSSSEPAPASPSPEDFSAAIALAHHNRGILFLQQGDPETALVDFDQAIDWDPQRASSYVQRGLAHAALENFAELLNDANAALERDPDLAAAHQLRGIARYHLGDGEGSLTDFDRAIEQNPEAGSAYQNRGIVYRDLKQTEQAVADLIEARERLVSQDYDRYQTVIRQLAPLQSDQVDEADQTEGS